MGGMGGVGGVNGVGGVGGIEMGVVETAPSDEY